MEKTETQHQLLVDQKRITLVPSSNKHLAEPDTLPSGLAVPVLALLPWLGRAAAASAGNR